MKLNKKTSFYPLLVFFVLLSFRLYGAESDDADFLAKEKENSLLITNYKLNKELKDKQEKEDELRRKQKQANEERERQKRLEEDKKAKEEAEKRKELAEKLREDQRLKLAEEQKALEEEKRRRVSRYKLVMAGEKDNVDLSINKDNFYMEDYSELGTPEDTTSSPVERDHIATTDIYVRLLVETNINSRRAGEYVGVVEKDVFSLDSKEVLIPKGSKFICSFEPLQTYGETALKSECSRVYFPNGKSMMITGAEVSDTMGRAGIVGDLDNRMWEKYGQTFIMSLLSGAAMMGADKIPDSDVASLGQYTALNILDLSTEMLDKTIDLAPVVTVPSGARLIVKLAVDTNLDPEEDNNKDE